MSLDALDVAGQVQLDLQSEIYTKRLDQFGMEISSSDIGN